MRAGLRVLAVICWVDGVVDLAAGDLAFCSKRRVLVILDYHAALPQLLVLSRRQAQGCLRRVVSKRGRLRCFRLTYILVHGREASGWALAFTCAAGVDDGWMIVSAHLSPEGRLPQRVL